MNKKLQHLAAAAALISAGLFAGASAQAASVVVDVTGAKSVNQVLEDGNTVWYVDIGANAQLTSMDWNVMLNAFVPSSLSEMHVSVGRSDGTNLVNLVPGAADSFSGTGSYSGSLDLTGLGFGAGADGKLRIEFNEYTKDFAFNVVEGQWVSGNLTFGVSAVPEPASISLLLLGLGAVAGARRVRRS
jgi:hypothetical protein